MRRIVCHINQNDLQRNMTSVLWCSTSADTFRVLKDLKIPIIKLAPYQKHPLASPFSCQDEGQASAPAGPTAVMSKSNQSQLAPVPHDVAQMSIAMDAHLMACWAYGFPMVSFLYSDNAFQKKFHEIPRFHQPHTVSIGYLIGNIWTPRICWSGHALARKCIIRR